MKKHFLAPDQKCAKRKRKRSIENNLNKQTGSIGQHIKRGYESAIAPKKSQSSFLILDFKKLKNDKYSHNFLKLLR